MTLFAMIVPTMLTIFASLHIVIVNIVLKRRKMTDLNPEIWDNPTLGRAANNERLDVLEKQQKEDRHAKLEGRKPRTVYAENDYPMWEAEKNRPSHAEVVHFTDEGEHEIPNPGGTPHKDRDYKTHPLAEKAKPGSMSEKTTKK